MGDNDNSSPTILEGERFEAVSMIVGQVAHDFNNLLTPLLAYPPLIRGDLPDGCYGVSLLDVVEKTARDMARITRQLLDLTTRRKFEKRPTDVPSVVERAIVDLKHDALAQGVTVETAVSPNLPKVMAHAERMTMAIFHVCRNGAEAMEKSGGRLLVKAEAIAEPVDRDSSCGHRLLAGEYVCVKIQDAGIGIPPEIRHRVFEPFVTTKKAGGHRGAGLGLSVAYRILRDHGGFIDLYSEPGQGTTVSLFFPVNGVVSASVEVPPPVVTPAMPPLVLLAPPPKAQSEPVPCDKGRILVVDDEKTILRLFQMILSSGIPDRRIDMASNGAEAVDLFKSGHHSVVLMDLHMPVMDGKVAFGEIETLCRDRNWKMPSVIFCTGFAPPDTVRTIVSANPTHCLIAKPVSSDTLVDVVKSRLV